MVLFLTFYKGKDGPIHEGKQGGVGVDNLITYIPNYIYRLWKYLWYWINASQKLPIWEVIFSGILEFSKNIRGSKYKVEKETTGIKSNQWPNYDMIRCQP